MRHPRLAAALSIAVVLALTACVPGAPTPRPSGTSTSSATPRPTSTPTAEAEGEPAEVVTAATVVVTASGISVFGTDGSTLASEVYRTDAATVAAHLAEALDEDATTRTDTTGSCPESTIYEFGGLSLTSPGGLGSAASIGSGDLYDAYVSAATTAGGVAIETVAGQHVGSTRATFEAAVGDEMALEQYEPNVAYGFDIVNPEDGPYDLIGVQAWFEGDRMTAWNAPAAIGFVGDCG